MNKGPRKSKDLGLDKDGVPIDPLAWTEADWADLFYGMQAIKVRIAARHAINETARPAQRP